MKRIPLWWILAGFGAALVAGVLWFTTARPVLVLPRLSLAPGYGLQTAAGELFTSEDGRGVVTLYSFAYTGCGERCGMIYEKLQAVDAALAQSPALDPPLRFVTLTIDPERDTPEILAGFRLPFEPQAAEWVWLTGEPDKLKLVSGGGFEVLYQAQEDGSIFFDPLLVLVDGNGIIRGEYEISRYSAESLVTYIDLLYEEIQQSSGAAKLAYEAAHFFACYPH